MYAIAFMSSGVINSLGDIRALYDSFRMITAMLTDEKQHWVPTCFIASIPAGQEPKVMEPDKCDAMGWFGLDNLPEPLSVITRLDIANYRKYLTKTDVNMI